MSAVGPIMNDRHMRIRSGFLLNISMVLNSTLQTFANLLKSFMGSGLLGLPHAFKEGGLLVGNLTLGAGAVQHS